MSKKTFAGGLSSLLGETKAAKPAKSKRGRPKTSTRVITNSSQEGTKPGETRATFLVKEDYLDKFKAIAYWSRLSIKEALNLALEDAIGKYERKHGTVKPIPKK